MFTKRQSSKDSWLCSTPGESGALSISSELKHGVKMFTCVDFTDCSYAIFADTNYTKCNTDLSKYEVVKYFFLHLSYKT